MGLRSSRILREVHPWLRVRLEWMGEVARIIGSGQTLISGNRTSDEQQTLFDKTGNRPVAAPGCSQHQYGFAADATYLPSVFISSKARPLLSPIAQTNEFMKNAAHHVNLTTVANDPGHVQIYPGAQFRSWAVARGLCNPQPARVVIGQSFPLVGGLIDSYCGPGFTSLQIRPTGFVCGPTSQITSLIGE